MLGNCSASTLLEKALEHGIIIRSGIWYKYRDMVLKKGRAQIINTLKTNAGLKKLIKDETEEEMQKKA